MSVRIPHPCTWLPFASSQPRRLNVASSPTAVSKSTRNWRTVIARTFIGLLAAFTSTASYSQVPLILAEACALLDTAERRSECLRVAAAASVPVAKATIEQSWDPVERAFVGLGGAIVAGALSHDSYQAMLVEVSKEIALFERRAPDRQDQARMLAASLDAHQDALRFWGEWIRFYSRRGNDLAYSGGLPMKMVGIESMISKYNLPTQKSDVWGINQGVERSSGLRAIWAEARRKSEEAFNQLKKLPPTVAK